MLNRRRIRQLHIALLCLTVLFSFLPRSAGAYGRIDTKRPVSLTLRYQMDKAVSNVGFSLYRVADVSGSGSFTLTGDFETYPVTPDQPDSAGWRALAKTLAAYAARDALSPLDSGKTGRDGILRFPTDGQTMLPGLYLVIGERYVSGNYTYTPSPFLVSLPDLDRETDQWVYDETVEPKYTREEHGGGGDSGGGGSNDSTVTRKVLKVWKDDGHEAQRPRQIVVQLLRDGKVYRTATLSEENDWRYTWYDLDAGYDWQLAEEAVPEEYTVLVSQEDITFVVTNTCQPDTPDQPEHPEVPDQPENPDYPENPNQPESPDRPDTPNPPDNPGGPGGSSPETPTPDTSEPSLPQTGVLWWPVPVLAGTGMLLFMLGWARARKWRREDER